ncbi:hypothetical protein UPYG_G00352920 [Umbra pygmaea]|uniref:Uncharacterized protein n=1 Tax=Umbra pygmaea TaxID=75934 RepID=A0ABD0VZG1_UMBPY
MNKPRNFDNVGLMKIQENVINEEEGSSKITQPLQLRVHNPPVESRDNFTGPAVKDPLGIQIRRWMSRRRANYNRFISIRGVRFPGCNL